MAQINIVSGLVQGKIGEGFGDPYNNQTYVKSLSTRKLVQDDIRRELMRKYGLVGSVTISTVNALYNMYIAANCSSLDAKDYWSAVSKTFDISVSDIRNLSKLAINNTGLKVTSGTVPAGGTSISIKAQNETKQNKRRTYSLIVFVYSPDGRKIGMSYSCANNAVFDEKTNTYTVPKEVRERWQKVSGGEFKYANEIEANIVLTEPLMNGAYIVIYNVEVGNSSFIFREGAQVQIVNGELVQID